VPPSAWSCETLVSSHHTTLRSNPKKHKFHRHCHGNLKFLMVAYFEERTKLQVLENTALRKIFGPKKDEISEKFSTLRK